MSAAVPGDSKDRTWVLQRACLGCGLLAPSVPPLSVAPRVRTAVDG